MDTSNRMDDLFCWGVPIGFYLFGVHLVVALTTGMGALLVWPAFQLVRRRWNARGKLLCLVFALTLGVQVAYLTWRIAVWRHDAVYWIAWLKEFSLLSLALLAFSGLAVAFSPRTHDT